MKVNVIAARASNFVIGHGSDLAIKDPADQKYFANETANSILIAGSNTGTNLPERVYTTGNRHLVIVSGKHAAELRLQYETQILAGNISIASTIDEALSVAADLMQRFPEIYTRNPYIIGGAQIYREIFHLGVTVDLIDEIKITEFPFPVEGDKFLCDFSQILNKQGEPVYKLVSATKLPESKLDAELAVYKPRTA